MTGQKKTKCKSKKKSKKTTTPRVIGLYGVKITKGTNERKAQNRENIQNRKDLSDMFGPDKLSGAEGRKMDRDFHRIESGVRLQKGHINWRE